MNAAGEPAMMNSADDASQQAERYAPPPHGDGLRGWIAKLRDLYEGEAPEAHRFRYGLLVFDLVTVLFIVVTSFLPRTPSVRSARYSVWVRHPRGCRRTTGRLSEPLEGAPQPPDPDRFHRSRVLPGPHSRGRSRVPACSAHLAPAAQLPATRSACGPDSPFFRRQRGGDHSPS